MGRYVEVANVVGRVLLAGGLLLAGALVLAWLSRWWAGPAVPARPRPAATVPAMPRTPARPGTGPVGELRPALWQAPPVERIALPPANDHAAPLRGSGAGLYVLPESVLADFAQFVRYVGELVGLLRESKQEIVVVLQEGKTELFSAAWWAIFGLGVAAGLVAVCVVVCLGVLMAEVGRMAKGVPR